MECEKTQYTILKLVDSWKARSLSRNPEYQRGEQWSLQQKQALVDSIFRRYPIPPIFLHRIMTQGLEGDSIRFEIVDGQQRILALEDFLNNEMTLLGPEDRRLRLPASIRKHEAPWAGKSFMQLDKDTREKFAAKEIDVFVIKSVEHPDEIRDLFIRLQSGTALSRQQIRDAWPGNIGPAIEALAGKLKRNPTCPLFRLVDKRGQRVEDDRDSHVADRQFCAQLLTLFLARERDPLASPGIGVQELDALYHDYTELDLDGPGFTRFKELLNHTADIVEISRKDATTPKGETRRKFRKLDVISLFLLLQDLTKSDAFRLNASAKRALAKCLLSDSEPPNVSRSTEGSEVRRYYEEWRKLVPDNLGIRRDSRRLFDETERQQIFKRDKGICGICKEPVEDGDAEYDHFPIPWRDGGKTVVENGRLVCTACHPRGEHFDEDDT